MQIDLLFQCSQQCWDADKDATWQSSFWRCGLCNTRQLELLLSYRKRWLADRSNWDSKTDSLASNNHHETIFCSCVCPLNCTKEALYPERIPKQCQVAVNSIGASIRCSQLGISPQAKLRTFLLEVCLLPISMISTQQGQQSFLQWIHGNDFL